MVGIFGGWSKDAIRTGLEYNRLDNDSGDGTSQIMVANYFNYSLSDKWDVFMRNDRTELVGGDTDTVFQTAYNPSAPYHATEWRRPCDPENDGSASR